MTRSEKYVCAFRGRRDSYQVPLALAEGNLLEGFVTDAYSTGLSDAVSSVLPSRWREKVQGRRQEGIPRHRVTCLWGVTALEHLRHGIGFSPSRTFAILDREFSLAAATKARAAKSNLFLYSPYAWEAFTARYPHDPHKVLFQYHPHPDMERRILVDDRQRFDFVQASFEQDAGAHLDQDMLDRSRNAWRHADVIVCASSFTKKSLTEAGAPPQSCRIVPYGVSIDDEISELAAPDTFEALFVGSGGQRKGLHHLLLAWGRAELPKDSRLTIVCRQVDPGFHELIRRTPRLRVIPGTSNAELKQLYRSSTLFVMPSLVEGFGFVYLEALAQGCPVLGTSHGGLPDLGDESDGVWQTEPGRIDNLVATLERLAARLPGNLRIRRQAIACARRWSWSQFREGIRQSARPCPDMGRVP